MAHKIFLLYLLLFYFQLKAQVKIGNNPSSINSSSILELESNTKGLLFPRVNTFQMNSIANIQGLTVFNIDSNCLCNNNGFGWINLCNTASGLYIDTMTNGFLRKSGSGTSSSPLLLGFKNGVNTNDVLQWNGTRWVSQKFQTQWIDTQNTTALKSVVSGANNVSSGLYSFALGSSSRSTGNYSFASGLRDSASGNYSFALGYQNLASSIGTLAFGNNNKATNSYSVAMGQQNIVTGFQAFTYGQGNNNAGNYTSLFGYNSKINNFGNGGNLFGNNSLVSGSEGIVLGGSYDTASGNYSAVRGRNSKASGVGALAFGDTVQSTGIGSYTFGVKSLSSGKYAYSFGYFNNSIGSHSFSIGKNNTSSGFASFAIGDSCIANSAYGFAMGKFVSTNGNSGAFVLGDNNSTNRLIASTANSFNSRFSGGYNLYSNASMTAGVVLSAGGGSWSSVSDKNKKENFKQINYDSILAGLLTVPVLEWNYISQSDSIRHIGPMAQDFYSVFKIGESDTTITEVDINGINFAAIKALYERIIQLNKELELYKFKLINLENVLLPKEKNN